MKLKGMLDIKGLSAAGKAVLRAGWCVDEDPDHLWLMKDQWLDSEHDRIFHEAGVETEAEVLEGQFVEFVRSLGLPASQEGELLARWAADSEFSVEWG